MLHPWIPRPTSTVEEWVLTTQRGPFFLPRNLLSNPFNCNCHLAWLGKWLRKRRVVSGNPRCQKPFFLKEIPIQDVAIQDFTCEGEEAGPGQKGSTWEAKKHTREERCSRELNSQDPLRSDTTLPSGMSLWL